MATRLISGEDVDARIRAAQASKATAEQELREAEANFAATAVSESLDELKLARERKKVDDAHTRLQRWVDLERTLFAAAEEAARQSAEARRLQKIAALDAVLLRRIKIGAEFDAWTRAGGEMITRFAATNEGVLHALPSQLSDIPACLNVRNFSNMIGERLFGESGGLYQAAKLGIGNAEMAKQRPTLEARLREERQRVLAQFPRTAHNTGPEAA